MAFGKNKEFDLKRIQRGLNISQKSIDNSPIKEAELEKIYRDFQTSRGKLEDIRAEILSVLNKRLTGKVHSIKGTDAGKQNESFILIKEKMNMYSFFENEKILNSVEAERGAERLMKKVEKGTLAMDVLPNTYDKFTGELEENDYISYCRFLKSSNGGKVLNMLEEEDAREHIKL